MPASACCPSCRQAPAASKCWSGPSSREGSLCQLSSHGGERWTQAREASASPTTSRLPGKGSLGACLTSKRERVGTAVLLAASQPACCLCSWRSECCQGTAAPCGRASPLSVGDSAALGATAGTEVAAGALGCLICPRHVTEAGGRCGCFDCCWVGERTIDPLGQMGGGRAQAAGRLSST